MKEEPREADWMIAILNATKPDGSWRYSEEQINVAVIMEEPETEGEYPDVALLV